ncbi:MAG: hypothetical protein II767_11065 [Proteobacteria bacterium]|nr:hypothetical protein [Pseudomonadota bacterium]
MKILIHACPQRMWYVNGFLIPMLQEQGAENIEVYNDTEKKGNLRACMDSFAARQGDGGTWHIQDDVLPSRDFVKKCIEHDEGLVYGFACRNFGDRLDAYGIVYAVDAWNSFQCVRIPDAYARECAAWVRGEKWITQSPSPELPIMYKLGNGDDTFFHEFMACMHPYDVAENLKPNIVEHVDWLLGGSSIQKWRDYIARAEFFEDTDLVDELRERIKRYHNER